MRGSARAVRLPQVLGGRSLESLAAALAAEEKFAALEHVSIRCIGTNAHAADRVDGLAIAGTSLFAGILVGMLVH
jgi:predicted hotdog family 3-hydroxylacyl-ACP dehydratase